MSPSNFGKVAACVIHDVPVDSIAFMEGQTRELCKSAGYGKQIAQLVVDAFANSSSPGDLTRFLYEDIAKSASWNEYHEEMTGLALGCLGRLCSELNEKRAFTAGAALVKRLSALAGGALPGALQWTLGGGAALGAGLGTLHWGLNRDASGNDADSEGMEAKIDYYDQLAKEINEEMKNRPPKQLRGAMQQRNVYA